MWLWADTKKAQCSSIPSSSSRSKLTRVRRQAARRSMRRCAQCSAPAPAPQYIAAGSACARPPAPQQQKGGCRLYTRWTCCISYGVCTPGDAELQLVATRMSQHAMQDGVDGKPPICSRHVESASQRAREARRTVREDQEVAGGSSAEDAVEGAVIAAHEPRALLQHCLAHTHACPSAWRSRARQ